MAVALRLLSAVNTSTAENAYLTADRSDYVVILAALFCALICAIGLAMVARYVCLHHHLDLSMMASGRPIPAPPPPGLNKKTLQLLPTTQYNCGAVGNEKRTDCAICLTEFADGDVMRILPQCGHVFHVTCIDTWLRSHSSCPSCRQMVLVVARCHQCGGFSANQGFRGCESAMREIDTMSRYPKHLHCRIN